MTTIALASTPLSSITAIRDLSRARRWTGRILTGLLVAFLAFDALMKVFYVRAVAEASAAMGMDQPTIVAIGVLLIACTGLYLIPRTSLLGAVLLTGYFGGAIAVHVLLHTGAFSIGFAAAFGVITWLGLALRHGRISPSYRRVAHQV